MTAVQMGALNAEILRNLGTIAEDEKHRIVYRVFETEVHIDILSTYGHYNDK